MNYAINTGKATVTDVSRQSISRGVHNGVTFANFKAHKFSYLNITSLGTDYVVSGKECGVACVSISPCLSFNLAAFHDINGKVLCELLSSDKYNNSDKFISSQSFHHLSIVVRPSLTVSLKSFLITVFLFFVTYYLQVLGSVSHQTFKILQHQCIMSIQMS